MKEFKKLIVWQKSIELVKNTYELVKAFPKSEEYGLVSQIKRASVSIPANIAEANGRNSDGERRQFFGIALGSSYELETEIILAIELKMIQQSDASIILGFLDEIQKMLSVLIKKADPVSKSKT